MIADRADPESIWYNNVASYYDLLYPECDGGVGGGGGTNEMNRPSITTS